MEGPLGFEVTGTPADMPGWLGLITSSAALAGPASVMQVLGLMTLEMLREQVRVEHDMTCPERHPSPWKESVR